MRQVYQLDNSRVFRFLAKQGQESAICRILTANVGKPSARRYSGPRGEGVMIALALPEGVSKRSVDQLLHQASVPGAVSRANRMRVFKASGGYVDTYHIMDQIGFNVPFKLVRDGKFMTAMLELVDYGCECCGTYTQLVDRNGKPL